MGRLERMFFWKNPFESDGNAAPASNDFMSASAFQELSGPSLRNDPWTNGAMIELNQNSSHPWTAGNDAWTNRNDPWTNGAMLKLDQNSSHPRTNEA